MTPVPRARPRAIPRETSRFPKLADLMDEAEDDVLAQSFPKEHWAQIHSTNPLERLNGEIKRRTDVAAIFPNDAAIVRLVGGPAARAERRMGCAAPLHEPGSPRGLE